MSKLLKYNKLKFIPRNNMTKHEWVKAYFTQTEYLSKIYYSGQFTDDDLLYYLPNNKLKRLGFPMKRGGKNKRYKKYKIHNFRLYDIIEEIIEEILSTEQNKFFNKFVDIKDLKLGDENIYEPIKTNFIGKTI